MCICHISSTDMHGSFGLKQLLAASDACNSTQCACDVSWNLVWDVTYELCRGWSQLAPCVPWGTQHIEMEVAGVVSRHPNNYTACDVPWSLARVV
jgi:hypothetical protein